MMLLKNVCKRARPILGTFFSIELKSSSQPEKFTGDLVTAAFEEAERLEKMFSKFSKESLVSQINIGNRIEAPIELNQILREALCLQDLSRGAFRISTKPSFLLQNKFIQKMSSDPIDLNGIAKGFIVDRAAAMLLEHDRSLSAVINAGGDIRFVNMQNSRIDLRLGSYDHPIHRQLDCPRSAVATSSFSMRQNPLSTTQYYGQPNEFFAQGTTVVVLADQCTTADALTKVAMFGDYERIARCAEIYKADILYFDENGDLRWPKAVA